MKTTKYCAGCRNNFYNGNNSLGIDVCWNLKTAKLVSRIPVGYWEAPPYKNKKKVKVLDCYHEEGSNRTVYLRPESIGKDGYWK